MLFSICCAVSLANPKSFTISALPVPWHPVQEQQTVAKWLQDFHYQTALIGKYVNGYHADGATPMDFCTYVPPGWTDWYGFQTVDFFGTRVQALWTDC